MEYLKGPGEFVFDENAAVKWPQWEARFIIFLKAFGKINESEDIKISILLNLLGETGLTIYQNFSFEKENVVSGIVNDDDDTVEDGGNNDDIYSINDDAVTLVNVLEKFANYCVPFKNLTMETFKFNNVQQYEGQSIIL